jgi:hypothetical protein
VVNGSGAIAGAPVTGVTVSCTTILQSLSPTGGTTPTTTATTYGSIPGVTPITVVSDVAADFLVSFVIPSFNVTASAGQVAIAVDGTPVAQAISQPYGISALPMSLLTIQQIPSGTHVISAMWSVPQGAASTMSYDPTYASELDVVVLESLPSFDQTRSSSTNTAASFVVSDGGTLPSGSQPASLGVQPLMLNTMNNQPAFLALVANVFGDRQVSRLSVDGNPLATYTFAYDINNHVYRTATPLGVEVLSAGNHTVDTAWYATAAARNSDSSSSAALMAAVFKAGTLNGTAESMVFTTADPPSANTFVPVPAQMDGGAPVQFQLDLVKQSKVLVTLDGTQIRPVSDLGQPADIVVFANGQQGPLVHYVFPNGNDWNSAGAGIVGVMDLPAGTTTFQLKTRVLPSTNLGNVQFDNIPIDFPILSIGAIVLD